ncbi:MAG: SPOR domain-containing protein [Pseudoxanthomonas sp.]
MLIRALIVLLVVLNLGMAAWWMSRPAPPPPAPPAQPQGVARLQLLAEAPIVPTTAPVEPPAPPPSEPAPATETATPATAIASASTPEKPATPPPQCFSLGPFADADATRKAIAALTGARGKVREAKGSSSGNYSVYLPPAASRDEAQALAKRIGDAGFDDFLIVRDNDMANGIALGVYRSPEGAQRRQAALLAAGFPAQIREPATSAPSQWWADITGAPGQNAAQARAKAGAAQSRALDCATLR